MNFHEIIRRYREFIVYIIVGVLTTILSLGVYFVLWEITQLGYLATAISWIVAVIFAFFANKIAVFRSRAMDGKTLFREFMLFSGCRLGTGIFDVVFIYFTVDWLPHAEIAAAWPWLTCRYYALAMKFVDEIVVTVVNYLVSKFWIFVKKEKI